MKTIIVFKTHVDIGFTDLAENVIRKYTDVLLPATVKSCEETQRLGKNKQFVWTMSSYMVKRCLDPNNSHYEQAKELAVSGQLAWHSLPFTTHTEFCGLEEYIRGLMISRKLSVDYGHWPISAKMTDVPGHTIVLPSILAKAGVKFFHIGSNPSTMPPDVPRLFWWEGFDGSRILTFYSKGAYGSSLTPPDDWPYPVWLAIMHTGDNQGPQNADFVKNLLEESPEIDAHIGTLDDFYNALIQYPLDIPVIKKDLADTWIHGTGTYPNETAKLRELRGKMTETEKLLALGTVLGFVDKSTATAAKECLDKAYEQCILYGEHTWGMDIKTVLPHNRLYSKKGFLSQKASPEYQKAERSWEEQRERYLIAERETAKAAALLSECGDGTKKLIFNGLGRGRDKLPAFGYVISDGQAQKPEEIICDATAGTLENKWFKLQLDPERGGIKSLFEKSKNKEWVDQKNLQSFGSYRYDVYSDEDITEFMRSYTYRFFDWSVNDLGRINYPEQPHLTFYGKNFSIKAGSAERNGSSATLVMEAKIDDKSVSEYGNARRIITKVTLYANKPHIDIRCELASKEESPIIEAGHFVFPVNLEAARVDLNKIGTVVDIATEIQKNANHALHCLEYFIDLTNGNNGLAFIPRHTHLVSVGSQNILKYKPEFENTTPDLYFNAFNNAYGTNFPQWIGGDFVFEFRIIPHDGDWKQGDIYRKALEYMLPVVEMPAPESAGDCSLFEGMDGMAALAFKLSEDEQGFVLRLRDISGDRHKTSITFPDLFSEISLCDLQERKTEKISGRKYVFETRPFEIHSFYLKV